MIKSLLLLSVLGLVYGLKEPHPDCPEEGHHLLPHEYDCTKFYYCEDGGKFVEPRDCPEDTEFSAIEQVCVHPSIAGCTLEGPVTEGEQPEPAPTEPAPTEPAPTEPAPTEPAPTEPAPTVPAPTEPAPTEPAPTEPAPTEPAPTEPAPTEPALTEPAPTEPAPTEPAPTVPAPTEPAPTEPAPTEPAPTEPAPTEEAAPTEPAPTEPAPTEEAAPTTESIPLTTDCERFENGCPVDFSIDEYLEHEVYCRLYYQCVFGLRVERRCPRGTVFNVRIPGCDHPENVDRTCEDWESSEETTFDPSEEEDEEREIDFNENGCPINIGISWYLPHEKYCNAYYQCDFGDKVMHICPEGTQFNPAEDNCDHYYNVDCQDRAATAFPSSTEPGPVNPPTLIPDFEANENGCPVDGRDWLLPHEDCTKYYMCVHGDLQPFDCPSGLHFNPSTQHCDNPATAGCANGPCANVPDCSGETSAEVTNEPVTEDAVTNEPVTEEAVTQEPVTEEAVTEEAATEEAVTEGAVTEEAVTEGDSTEEAVTEGAVTEDVTEEAVTEGAVTEGDVTEEAVTEDVTEGDVTEEAVTDGAVTEDVTEEAVTEGDVTEEAVTEGAVTEDVTEEAVTEGAVTEEDVDVATTERLPEDDECSGEDCEKTYEDKKCEEECHVLPFPHDDCDKFWICYGNKAQLVTCANGLYFNPAKHICDFACNVNCDSLKSRVTPHHEGINMYIPWKKMDSRATELVELINKE